MSLADATAIGEVLAEHARQRGEVPALVPATRAAVTFGELGQLINSLQGQLAAAGIGPGARVGLAFPRGLEAAILSLGVSSAATLVPLNIALPPTELARELALLKLHALVFPDGDVPAWAGEDAEAGRSPRASTVPTVTLRPVRPVSRSPASDAARLYAAIFRTSGTTGASKRVPVTHREPDRDGAQDGALAGADAGRPLSLHHAHLLQCRLQGDAAGAADDRLQRRLVRIRACRRISTDGWRSCGRPGSPRRRRACSRRRCREAGSRTRLQHSLRFVLSTASYLPAAHEGGRATCSRVPVGRILRHVRGRHGDRAGAARRAIWSVGRIPKGELAS